MASLDERNLAVLARAVHFRNLSAASAHVGLSQPQLSRVVKALEKELGLVLLDRTVKRQARWTAVAQRVAQAYGQAENSLQRALHQLQSEAAPSRIHAAALDGLMTLALEQLARFQSRLGLKHVHFDVLDQNELEEQFLAGELDLAWNSRYPGRGKWSLMVELGGQSLDERGDAAAGQIFSTFEFQRRREKKAERTGATFVSNSLKARTQWQETSGWWGRFPSAVRTDRGRTLEPVLLIGQGPTAEVLWPKLEQLLRR